MKSNDTRQQTVGCLCPMGLQFSNRNLNDGKPLFRVGLIPYTIHIAGAWSVYQLIAHPCNLGKQFEITVLELAVGSIHLHTDCRRILRKGLELHDIGFLPCCRDLLAILYLKVLGPVFLRCLNGEAISNKLRYF